MEPVDGLAYIGRNPLDEPNVFIATGDSGMGLTHGTIAGILLTDLILGKENPWEKLYDPHRITLKATPDFAKENLNVAKEYAEWLTPGEVKDESEIAPDTGAILRRGTKKLAVYRDAAGKIHERSAVCSPPGLHRLLERHRALGTVPATAHATPPPEKSSTALRTAIWRIEFLISRPSPRLREREPRRPDDRDPVSAAAPLNVHVYFQRIEQRDQAIG